jgi:cytochrome c biogenesis protein CcmG/thiol:disulfide interchange protein DsbE
MSMRVGVWTLLMVVLMACQRETAGPANAAFQVGGKVPEYRAAMLDGRPFQLPDDQGRVLLVNIWATWCGPCRYEIPELKLLQQRHANRKFDVIGVSVDTEDAAAQVREFVREQQINYPIVLDPEGTITTLMNTTVLPTTALIDRTGKVVWMHIGVVESRNPELDAVLKTAL